MRKMARSQMQEEVITRQGVQTGTQSLGQQTASPEYKRPLGGHIGTFPVREIGPQKPPSLSCFMGLYTNLYVDFENGSYLCF